MNNKIYLVGGAVRDEILGRKSKDIDYAFEGTYEEMRSYILDNGGTIFQERPEFVTIRCLFKSKAVDFVACRSDGFYSDGRHPDEISYGTIYQDLARRDFTMNAIAFDIAEKRYIDPFGGATDIVNETIRCVGKTHDRFKEDALRMIRALRFSVTMGFRLDYNIGLFLSGKLNVDLLDNVSEERIYEELKKMFAHNTLKSLMALRQFPALEERLLSRNIWLKPTMEER